MEVKQGLNRHTETFGGHPQCFGDAHRRTSRRGRHHAIKLGSSHCRKRKPTFSESIAVWLLQSG